LILFAEQYKQRNLLPAIKTSRWRVLLCNRHSAGRIQSRSFPFCFGCFRGELQKSRRDPARDRNSEFRIPNSELKKRLSFFIEKS